MLSGSLRHNSSNYMLTPRGQFIYMKQVTAIMLIIAVFTSGCASVYHGTTEQIWMTSDEPDTKFTWNGREVGRGTSAVVIIPKDELEDAELKAEKEGFYPKTTKIPTGLDGITLLGLLVDFGLISILVVDYAATGATEKAIQNHFVLTPSPMALESVNGRTEQGGRPRVRLGYDTKDWKDGSVIYITPNSPAERAGLVKGCRILGINNKEFSRAAVESEIFSKKPGDKVSLTWVEPTGGQLITKEITLEAQ